MKKLIAAVFTLTSVLAMADTFTPIRAETSQYSIKASAEFKHLIGTDLKNCVVTTKLNNDQTAIEFRMGIEGSNFAYFGWDMFLPLEDFPLHAGYYKEFKTPGMSSMALSFDGTKLSFKYLSRDGLWNRIHPFELIIDPNLTTPKALKASLEGYERDLIGRPKKHVIEQCIFGN